MLKKILLASILIFLIAGMGFAFQNEPDGFRGLKWGDPPIEDMDMIFYTVSGEIVIYRKAEDKMDIGDAKLYSLEYDFWKKRFIEVDGYFKNKKNYDILKTICEKKFGKPTSVRIHKYKEDFGEPTKERLFIVNWTGSKTTITLFYDSVIESGSLSLLSRKIWRERIQEELERIREAKGNS